MYADSSALVKLVIDEPESAALEQYFRPWPLLVTNRIALVEVLRATGIANPTPEVRREAERLVLSCMLVDVTEGLVSSAVASTSAAVRTLDAIHLASALQVEPDELVAYNRRLLDAAAERGLAVASPGAAPC